MAARYRLSASANQQLDDIYCYTLATWGEAQAERYIHELFACFEGIANGDVQGRLIQPEYGSLDDMPVATSILSIGRCWAMTPSVSRKSSMSA